jgi:hypothetical protein
MAPGPWIHYLCALLREFQEHNTWSSPAGSPICP